MSVLADWLARQAPAWLDPANAGPPLTPAQRRALLAIVRCRTPALGGQVYVCTSCLETHYAYHSCHHRACPRCGGARTAEWTKRQTERLLPVPYFLITFTVPEALRPLCAARPELLYDLLFTHSALALQSVAARPQHLGGELGMIGVLHTWGRQLQLHPHIHYIVPGGALRADGNKWNKSRQPEWLLPNDALAAAFRRAMEEALRAQAPELHAQVPDSVWREAWWVHTQPAGSGEAVVRYLARYVSRTAISDERILEATAESVRFAYTGTDDGLRHECTLSAREFMRRYLQHVLPVGLHRIRYFGWLHPAAKARRLQVETLLAVLIVVRTKEDLPPPWHLLCPRCENFTLVRVGRLARAPPSCAS